jgi:antitoxin (DNA-binding transcriptional repressor) of toxin-antitoxin stability system
MKEVSMFEAKTQPSKLVELANEAEEVVNASGRARKPVVRIVAIEPKQRQARLLGLFKGVFKVGLEFSNLCLKRSFVFGIAKGTPVRRVMRQSSI